MPNIALIRHSTSKPIPGVSAHTWALTESGVERCALLADALKPYAFSRVATSDEPKASSTAEMLVHHLHVTAPLIVEPAFRETRRESAAYFDDPGLFRAAIREAMASPDQIVFGEEAFADSRDRFTTAIDALAAAYPSESIAVVTHGTVMSMVLAHWTDLDAYATWSALEMPAFAILTHPEHNLIEFKPALDEP